MRAPRGPTVKGVRLRCSTARSSSFSLHVASRRWRPAVVKLADGAKLSLSAGKDGYLRSVNLATNAQRWQTPVMTISNATAPITVGGTHFCPAGGLYGNGPGYSPLTGLVYVNTVDWCKTVKREAQPEPDVPGQPWLGSSDGEGVKDATRSGWVNAVNAATGAIVWQYHAALPMVAGITPTSGGLVFTADLPVGGGVISYAVNGTQYVAVAAGLSSGNFQTPTTGAAIVVFGF